MKSYRIYLACVPILLGLWTAAFAQTFTRVDTSIITRDGTGFSTGASWGDYDNDGDDDLFISNSSNLVAQKNFLYRNEGEGYFTRITTGEIVTETSAFIAGGASWGDFDNDGNLDLFFAQWGNDRLYHNDGSGVFSKIAAGIVSNNGGNSIGSSWVDYDGDGDLDLFVVNGSLNGLLSPKRTKFFIPQ